jgi:hypothetical protein
MPLFSGSTNSSTILASAFFVGFVVLLYRGTRCHRGRFDSNQPRRSGCGASGSGSCGSAAGSGKDANDAVIYRRQYGGYDRNLPRLLAITTL